MNGRLILLVLLGISLATCKPDAPQRTAFEINTRLSGEPDRLNPMLSSVGYATDVLRLTHFPLLEFNPITLVLEPIIAAKLPEVIPIDTGIYAGGQAFVYEIRPEARWDDGKAITAHDYIFTLKAAFNPLVKANSWRGVLSFIKDVTIDPENDRKFTVFTADDYFLALPATGNFNLYPRHLYDPQGYMDGIALIDLADPAKGEELAASEPKMLAFAEQFTSDAWSRDTSLVKGAGPYQVTAWETGQYVVLDRKANWWGDELEDEGDQFKALPARIRFKIIPDEQAAVSLLRDGGLDILGGVTPSTFQEIKADTAIQTHLPIFMQYVFLALNNRNPKLEDARTRRALAHLIDMDEVTNTILLGLGERITGPFHPSKPYYNHAISPIDFDPEKARVLLKEAGWEDSNKNGIVDKIIGGKRVELELTLLLRPGTEVGEQFGLLWQQQAQKAGVAIKVESKDFKLILADMGIRNYDVSFISLRSHPADDDPYQNWHSDSDRPDGSNRYGYRNLTTDSLIMAIRSEKNTQERYRLYKEVHEQIYKDQPVIFLYAPKEPILARKALKGMEVSPMRPGYYLPFLHF